MPAALLVQLIVALGPSALSLVGGLISTWEAKGSVSSAEWATMMASISQSSSDLLKAQITAAGIDLASPQAVALLALVK